MPPERGEHLVDCPRVVVRVTRAPGSHVLEDVGLARDRRLPGVEAHERRPFEEDVLGLEADVADAREEPEIRLGLLECERDPGRARVKEAELQPGVGLHVPIEGDRRQEGRVVEKRGDALGDVVTDAQVRGHALDERAVAAPLGVGAARRGVHAGRDVEVLEHLPERVVARVVREPPLEEDRTDEDWLFQVLLDWGVDLTLPITPEKIKGMTVYFVDTNALAACFETGIDEAFIKNLATRKPLRAVFRDTGYGSDATKINVEQIFKLLSPATEVKSL